VGSQEAELELGIVRDTGLGDEKNFISLLTAEAICGMIAPVWAVTAWSGDADAEAEAPPG
jgi:hypothetical protein